MRILFIQNHPVSWASQRLQAWLNELGLQVDVRRAYQGQLPQQIKYSPDSPASDHIAGLVIGGGMAKLNGQGAYSWWMPHVHKLIEQAVDQHIPTLGICLGAQAIAYALGGEMGGGMTRDNGATITKQPVTNPEFGLCDIRLTGTDPDDPLMANLPNIFPMYQHHEHSISRLPDNSVLLATSDNCPVEAFRHRDYIYGVQFHPEVYASDVRLWSKAEVDRLVNTYHIDYDTMVRRSLIDARLNEDCARQLVHNFAKIVRSRANR